MGRGAALAAAVLGLGLAAGGVLTALLGIVNPGVVARMATGVVQEAVNTQAVGPTAVALGIASAAIGGGQVWAARSTLIGSRWGWASSIVLAGILGAMTLVGLVAVVVGYAREPGLRPILGSLALAALTAAYGVVAFVLAWSGSDER